MKSCLIVFFDFVCIRDCVHIQLFEWTISAGGNWFVHIWIIISTGWSSSDLVLKDVTYRSHTCMGTLFSRILPSVIYWKVLRSRAIRLRGERGAPHLIRIRHFCSNWGHVIWSLSLGSHIVNRSLFSTSGATISFSLRWNWCVCVGDSLTSYGVKVCSSPGGQVDWTWHDHASPHHRLGRVLLVLPLPLTTTMMMMVGEIPLALTENVTCQRIPRFCPFTPIGQVTVRK